MQSSLAFLFWWQMMASGNNRLQLKLTVDFYTLGVILTMLTAISGK